MHTVERLSGAGYEYAGAVAVRYPGFTASEWVTNYETETGDNVEFLCRTRYPRYRTAYDGFTPYTFVVQHGVKDFT